MHPIIHNILHLLAVLILPPLLLSVIATTKALVAGRVGPPLLQPYYDLIKLFRKGSVFSTTTTWVFRAGPVVGLATVTLALLLIPLADSRPPLSFTGDWVLLAYLLGLGRFFTTSAALDTGSAFEGMGDLRLPRRAGFPARAACPGQAVRLTATGHHARPLAGASLDDCRRLPGPGPAELVHRSAGGELAHSLR